MFALRACSSRPPSRATAVGRTLALSAVARAEPSSSSPSSSSSSRPAGVRQQQQPRLGDSRGRGRSEGGVNFSTPARPSMRRGDGGSALESRPLSAPAGRLRRPSTAGSSSDPAQFDDAPPSGARSGGGGGGGGRVTFQPRPDLVRRDKAAGDAAANAGAYRSSRTRPAVLPVSAASAGGSYSSSSLLGGAGGRAGSAGGAGSARPRSREGGFVPGGGGGGGGGAGAGAGRGGWGGKRLPGGGRAGSGPGRQQPGRGGPPRKSPAYTGEAFLPRNLASLPSLAPTTLPANSALYSADDYLLASPADKPLAAGRSAAFPEPPAFYARLRHEVFAEGPSSGLRVLKHRTNAEHLLVGSLGPAAFAAGQKLVGELPALLARGAKREDQGLLTQTVDELDPESGVWKPAGKVDYSAELARRFDPYKPGKPHPRRVFRLTTHSTLGADDDLDAADGLASGGTAKGNHAGDGSSSKSKDKRELREARQRLYRSRPAIELVTLEHPPVPDPAAAGHATPATAELLARIDAERAKGDYGRWADLAELDRAAQAFAQPTANAAAAAATDKSATAAAAAAAAAAGGPFRQGRKAALDLATLGFGWAGNQTTGRERALQKAVIEGLVKL